MCRHEWRHGTHECVRHEGVEVGDQVVEIGFGESVVGRHQGLSGELDILELCFEE